MIVLGDPEREISAAVLASLRLWRRAHPDIRPDCNIVQLLGDDDSTYWAESITQELKIYPSTEDWSHVSTVQEAVDLLVKAYKSDLRNR